MLQARSGVHWLHLLNCHNWLRRRIAARCGACHLGGHCRRRGAPLLLRLLRLLLLGCIVLLQHAAGEPHRADSRALRCGLLEGVRCCSCALLRRQRRRQREVEQAGGSQGLAAGAHGSRRRRPCRRRRCCYYCGRTHGIHAGTLRHTTGPPSRALSRLHNKGGGPGLLLGRGRLGSGSHTSLPQDVAGCHRRCAADGARGGYQDAAMPLQQHAATDTCSCTTRRPEAG